jgi:hypothetical protein
MNQRKILRTLQNATPNGEGSTALPVSHNLSIDLKGALRTVAECCAKTFMFSERGVI